MIFCEKPCSSCGRTFQPRHGRTHQCDECKAGKGATTCQQCGSLVSGRARWGDAWGGECDRAEQRASALLDRLDPDGVGGSSNVTTLNPEPPDSGHIPAAA